MQLDQGNRFYANNHRDSLVGQPFTDLIVGSWENDILLGGAETNAWVWRVENDVLDWGRDWTGDLNPGNTTGFESISPLETEARFGLAAVSPLEHIKNADFQHLNGRSMDWISHETELTWGNGNGRSDINRLFQGGEAFPAVLAEEGVTSAATARSGGLKFSFNAAPGTPHEVIDGFVTASRIWSFYLTDDVTVNVDIVFDQLQPGRLGAASSTLYQAPYTTARQQLNRDITSGNDFVAVDRLPTGNSVPVVINHTRENFGSHVPYLDNNGSDNNAWLHLTGANAKALGFDVDGRRTDAVIRMSSNVAWDFNRSDGITANAYDFVGVAVHELGHALGFRSEVDLLDARAANGSDQSFSEDAYRLTPLDLFRFSAESAVLAAIDVTVDNRDKYFSHFRAQSGISMATGRNLGNGEQASHWNNMNIGIMGPVVSPGAQINITAADLLAFDVIGWDLA